MLSEEEKKAIERLKTDENKIDGLCEDIIESRNTAIETILKLITKLQKENEILKTTINKQSADISNNLLELQQKDKYIKDSEDITTEMSNDINKLLLEIKEKDKQIDSMAEYISNLDIDEDICKEQSDSNCDDINREVECNECIKQYFEKQANEKGE